MHFGLINHTSRPKTFETYVRTITTDICIPATLSHFLINLSLLWFPSSSFLSASISLSPPLFDGVVASSFFSYRPLSISTSPPAAAGRYHGDCGTKSGFL